MNKGISVVGVAGDKTQKYECMLQSLFLREVFKMMQILPRNQRPYKSVREVIAAIDKTCNIDSHKPVLKVVTYLADALGCGLHLEPKVQDSKVIISYKENLIFTIRSVTKGLWAEFFDPDNKLQFPEYLRLIKAEHHKEEQYAKYQLNKSYPFDESALSDVCILLAYCYNTRQTKCI
jgi:hypothetical protein